MLHHDGESVVQRHRPTSPEAWFKTIAPSRDQSVMAVECLCTWYGLAALCARAGLPFVLGQALEMHALHGGKAKHDQRAAQPSAVRRRGGLLPQAEVYPAKRRATRARLRQRRPRMRPRAALLPHVQQPNRPYNGPEMGNKSASTTNRAGGAERLPEPAVPKRLEVDLALSDDDAQWLRDLAVALVQTAQPQDANPVYGLQTVPGLGQLRPRVRL